MTNPIFHIGLLSNYKVVNTPGVYIVTVGSTVTEKNLITDEHPRYLVPLRVTTPKGLLKITELFELTDEIPFGMISDCFLTGAMFLNNGVDKNTLPVKGEKLLATLDEKDGEWRCTNIELLPRTDLDYVDVDNLCKFRSTLKRLIK